MNSFVHEVPPFFRQLIPTVDAVFSTPISNIGPSDPGAVLGTRETLGTVQPGCFVHPSLPTACSQRGRKMVGERARSVAYVINSAHPLSCAAGLAALHLYEKENLFARALRLESMWADAVHSLKGLPNVLDIRSVGLSAAIDLAAKPGARGKRGFAAMDRAFRDFDLLLRAAGDTRHRQCPTDQQNEFSADTVVERGVDKKDCESSEAVPRFENSF